MPGLRFSIVLCTKNRAHLLESALASIAAIEYPKDAFELVLVDNGSTDGTRELVEGFRTSVAFDVRYAFEERPGLSAARNRGIREARGEYVFFTDDDQHVDPKVLSEHERVAVRFGARVQQGGIELRFSGERPIWIEGELAAVLGETARLDEGPQNISLYGGNMCFRREVFTNSVAFREDLGKGAAGYSEDIEITRRLEAAGERIVYAPSARIFHVIGPDRASVAFFVRNSFLKGSSDGLMLDPRTPLLGVAGNAAVGLVRAAAGLAFGAVTMSSHRVIKAQARAANLVGRCYAFARRRLSAERRP